MDLGGLNIVESPWLAGQKRAMRIDDTVFVSPAMMDLLTHADEDELRRLLESIPVLDLGDAMPLRLFKPMPVTMGDK